MKSSKPFYVYVRDLLLMRRWGLFIRFSLMAVIDRLLSPLVTMCFVILLIHWTKSNVLLVSSPYHMDPL
jgi:hypothetical protein